MVNTPIGNQSDPYNAVVWWNDTGEFKYLMDNLPPETARRQGICISRIEHGVERKHFFNLVDIDSNGVRWFEEMD